MTTYGRGIDPVEKRLARHKDHRDLAMNQTARDFNEATVFTRMKLLNVDLAVTYPVAGFWLAGGRQPVKHEEPAPVKILSHPPFGDANATVKGDYRLRFQLRWGRGRRRRNYDEHSNHKHANRNDCRSHSHFFPMGVRSMPCLPSHSRLIFGK